MVEKLGDLKVYRNSLELSRVAWRLYRSLPRELRFDIGSQFLRSVDSVGANIAEGFGRFHYKDKIKFYYNARGSLWESKHWAYLLYQRELITKAEFEEFVSFVQKTGRQLNNFIRATGAKDG
ncbi:four helix bundle protein [Nitratifractor sp.]